MDFTEEQQALVNEYEQKYGYPGGLLPEGVENTDSEYEGLLVRLFKAGIEPDNSGGWAPAGTTKKASKSFRAEVRRFVRQLDVSAQEKK